MARKEAIRRMECCRDFLANNYSDMGEPNVTAFNMSIKALEQEPCEDAVSRDAFITRYKEWMRSERGKIPNDDTLAIRVIKSLPPVRPKPRTGHWIPTYGNVKCSVCGSVKSGRDVGRATHYCDFCGAEMESD